MSKQVVLTGITTSGTPHLGNYAGAIRPAIASSQHTHVESYLFLADYHAIIKCQDPALVRQSRLEVAATWLAMGLDPERVTFYRQSDVPEVMELNWMLSCLCAKGLMNRSHAYKAAVEANVDGDNADPDKGITMGLFSYPVLMAADILLFDAHKVPVGKDQIQHVEMARDMAQRFNHLYGDSFVLPEAAVGEDVAVLAGLDGRKMSKSYNNTIPLFEPEKRLRKLIMKIKTNSLEPGEPKDTAGSTLFDIYKAFATPEQTASIAQAYADGIAWGEMKQQLFELLNAQLAEPRERYQALMQQPELLDQTLLAGAEKARAYAKPKLAALREKIGMGR